MGGYVLRRLWQTIPVLFVVSLLAFAIMHVVPGDPVRLIAGPDAPESVVERIRVEPGLDRPLREQYWSFLGRALRGDRGRSLLEGAGARRDPRAFPFPPASRHDGQRDALDPQMRSRLSE